MLTTYSITQIQMNCTVIYLKLQNTLAKSMTHYILSVIKIGTA